MDNSLYYRPTGKVPFSSILVSIILGSIAGIILAASYVLLQWFIPLVYFNFLITLGFAFGLFYALNFLHKNGKIRNLTVALISVVVSAIIGYYVHWALYVSLMFNTSGSIGDIWLSSSFDSEGFLFFLLHPQILFEAIDYLNEVGTFSLKSTTVSGTFLWIIWIIELLVMIVWPAILVFGGQSTKPFSEEQNSWMEPRGLDSIFPYVEDKGKTKEDFENGNYQALQNPFTEEESIQQDHFMVATVHELQGDPSQYLTLTNVKVEYDKNGEAKNKQDIILEYLRLPTGTF